jgi:hypothetical protein
MVRLCVYTGPGNQSLYIDRCCPEIKRWSVKLLSLLHLELKLRISGFLLLLSQQSFTVYCSIQHTHASYFPNFSLPYDMRQNINVQNFVACFSKPRRFSGLVLQVLDELRGVTNIQNLFLHFYSRKE